MTNADKRKVIEVLLCSAQRVWEGVLYETTTAIAHLLGESQQVSDQTGRYWIMANDALVADAFRGANGFIDHGTVCLEAAYRLIESSPALRREWFGR